jgi:glucose-6-phosphate 1-dehydrogenase
MPQGGQSTPAGPGAQLTPSDGLIFFGATGDLAFKKIFPALQAMAGRGRLTFPVVGVARSGWNRERFVQHARESVTTHGQLDERAFALLSSKLHYIDGDYSHPATFTRLAQELSSIKRPTHYLAIPPAMFGPVTKLRANAGCLTDARVIVEKPFGRDLQTARELNVTLHQYLSRGP